MMEDDENMSMEDDENMSMEVNETEITISNFPDEVILEILGFLDFESLKNATFVCKKWDRVIGSSAKTMKNFVLNLDAARVGNLVASFCSKRKHINVHIHFEKQDDELLNVVKQFDVSQARRVSFHRYKSSIHIKRVRKVLVKMPLLEDASLMLNKVEVPKRLKILRLKLKKFKRIRFFPVACNALKLFNPKQIVELRVEESPIVDDIGKLVDFLQDTTNLNILRVNKSTFNAIFEHERNFSFRLKTIDMLYLWTEVSAVVGENFDKFLRTQAATLKVLDLSGLEGLSDLVHETVLNRLKCLTKLTVDGSFLPDNKQFYANLKRNKSLKTLVMLKNFSSDEAAKGIFGVLPELEELNLNFSVSTKINFIASHNPKLKRFSCATIHRSITKGLNFNNLTSLTVLHVIDVQHWLSIIRSSPNIENLTVFWVDEQITEDFIDILLQQPLLKHLKLIGSSNKLNTIFDRLKINHGNLRSLDLAIKLRPSEHATETLKITLPDDLPQRNFSQEKQKFVDSVWNKFSNEPKTCSGVNDIIKFKFETGQITTVSPDMIAL